MAKVDDAVRDLIYYHGKRAAREVLDELPERVQDMRRELRDLRKTVRALREQVEVLTKHRRQQMDIPPAPEETVEESRVTRRTLKSIRKKFELSQDELAELLDVAPGTISQWETGQTKPRSNNKARIITLRDMEKSKVDEILGREGGEPEWSGDRLRQLRESQGMTQEEVGELLGVSPNTVSGWESGRTQPSGANLEKIRELEEKSPEALGEAVDRREFDGARLRDFREELGLSRANVAELLGVSYASVQNWETGDTKPRGANLQKIDEFMQKSPDELKEAAEDDGGREFDGDRLTELKQKLDLGQGQLADLLGVTNATVWSWETGRTTPSPKNVEKVEKLEQKSVEEVQNELEEHRGDED